MRLGQAMLGTGEARPARGEGLRKGFQEGDHQSRDMKNEQEEARQNVEGRVFPKEMRGERWRPPTGASVLTLGVA